MKRKLIGALLVCILMLALVGLGQTQIIAPISTDSQVPGEILLGLMGKYITMVQQRQELIAQDATPDSDIAFRLAAEVMLADGEVDSGLDFILTDISKMAFWIKANILTRYPYQVRLDLSGSLGDMEVVTTEAESILISRDEAVFSILPVDVGMADLLMPADFPAMDFEELLAALELLQGEVGILLLQELLGTDMEYDGLELTPRGMAHVVRLTFVDTGEILRLWVLDETWDLCKVGFDDPEGGISMVMVIENIELVAAPLPDSTFDYPDTTALAELPYDDLVEILDLKVLPVVFIGVPVGADLSLSLPEISQGESVVVSSNGMDGQDAESDLAAQMEYRGPDGVWTPLEASYVGIAPLGRWEAIFATTTDSEGAYDFRVTYKDTAGNVSEPLELLAALLVSAVPPQVVDTSPGDGEMNVPVSVQVAVTFSQAMDSASVEAAFSLSDSSGQAVSGSFEWTETAFVFTPDTLTHGEDYLAKILGTAMALNAATLDANMDGVGVGSPVDDFVWRFATEYAPLPKVVEVSPGDRERNVLVSAQVSVTFTEAMDQASAENAFSLTSTEGQAVSGSFQWSDNTLTFVPSQNLEYNATYQAEIRGSAASALGAGLDANENGIAEGSPEDDLSWWFSTEKYPVLAVRPASETALGGDFVTVDIVAQSVSQLSSFAFTIDIDPTVLGILKVERVSFANWRPRPKIITDVDVWQPTVIDKEQGLITIAADSTRAGGVTGTGNIATLTFQAVGVGESPIQLQDVSFTNALGEDVSPEVRDGSVQVLEVTPWDVNKDGIVNILDFIIIQADRGASADVNGDGVVNILDMVAAAGGAQASPGSEPLVSALCENFPNPCNPETWIPYQLARDASVAVRIYSATGRLVRSLDLGYKHAGRYITRAAAAHWDGTNEYGERVASGIYYYNIKAGDFSATRKLVVSQ